MSSRECFGYGAAADAAGTCYVAGSISGLACFGGKLVTGSQKSDAFAAKLLSGAAASPVSLAIRRLSAAQFQIEFTGDSCSNYRLQGSADLKEWSTLTTVSALTQPMVFLETTAPERKHRFFRVV